MTLLDITYILIFLSSRCGIKSLCRLCHILVEIPEGIIPVTFICLIRSRSAATDAVWAPTVAQPPFIRVDIDKFRISVRWHYLRQTRCRRLLYELAKIGYHSVGVVEMSMTGIAKERYAALRMFLTIFERRVDARLPPFVFTFDHKPWYAVNIVVAPLHILSAITGKFRLWRIAMDTKYGKCALRTEGGEVPRECCQCRMTYRDHRCISQLFITADIGKVAHHLFKTSLRINCRIPCDIYFRSHPYHGETQFRHRLTKYGIVEYSLFYHVMHTKHDTLYLPGVRRHPQKSMRMTVSLR